jgi:hypothetical protein
MKLQTGEPSLKNDDLLDIKCYTRHAKNCGRVMP